MTMNRYHSRDQPASNTEAGFSISKRLEETTMRNFSIDLIWAKIQIAITAIGGWLGYFLEASTV